MGRGLWAIGLAAIVLGACGGEGGGGDRGERSEAPASTTEPADERLTCEPLAEGIEEVDVAAGWEVGDRVELRVLHRRDDERRQDELEEDGAALAPVTITVEEARDDGGWVLRWEQENSLVPLPEEVRDDVGDLQMVDVRYAVDEFGAFVDILNRDEVMAQTLDLVEAAFESSRDPEVEEVREAFEHNDGLRTLLESTLGREIGEYHALYGVLVSPDDPIDAVVGIPSPLGGTIQARHQIGVDELTDDDGCVVLDLDVRPRPAALRRYLRTFFEELLPPGQEVPADEMAALQQMELAEGGRFRWDPGSTWMVQVETTQDVTLPGEGMRHDERQYLADEVSDAS